MDHTQIHLTWKKYPSAKGFYQAEHDGQRLLLRLNNFPDVNAYTLIYGTTVIEIENTPAAWEFAPSRSDVYLHWMNAKLQWQRLKESSYCYQTSFNGQSLMLLIHNTIEDGACTLILEDDVLDFESMPSGWTLL